MKLFLVLFCAFPYLIYANPLATESTLLEQKIRDMLSSAVRFVESILPAFCTSPMCAKILLSIGIFIVLWLCRSSLAKLAIYCIDMILHLSKQDTQTRRQIQRALMKPITLFLLVMSVNISLDVLYLPDPSPKGLEVWFKVVYVINGTWFVIIISQGYVAALLASLAQKRGDHFRREVINLLLKIGYFIIVVIALLWILKILGFNISAIIASLGLGGLAVALAVKDMLANFFASVMLLFDNSFSQGERIQCGDVDGVVVEMGLRRTTIRTGDNALVLIPNAELANKSIINWSRRKAGRRIYFSLGLTYGTPPDKILQCIESIKAMLLAHPLIAKESTAQDTLEYGLHLKRSIVSLDDYLGYKYSIYVVLDELADSSMNILVYCFSKGVSLEEYLLAKEQVIIEILRIVDKLGLSLAFPSQSLYVESLPHQASLT